MHEGSKGKPEEGRMEGAKEQASQVQVSSMKSGPVAYRNMDDASQHTFLVVCIRKQGPNEKSRQTEYWASENPDQAEIRSQRGVMRTGAWALM